MSTPETPPSTPSTPTTPGSTGYGFQPVAGARMPIPGNAEFLVFAFMWIVLFIFWLASDQVGAGSFVTLTTILAVGYMLSRGIAKASRVLEQ